MDQVLGSPTRSRSPSPSRVPHGNKDAENLSVDSRGRGGNIQTAQSNQNVSHFKTSVNQKYYHEYWQNACEIKEGIKLSYTVNESQKKMSFAITNQTGLRAESLDTSSILQDCIQEIAEMEDPEHLENYKRVFCNPIQKGDPFIFALKNSYSAATFPTTFLKMLVFFYIRIKSVSKEGMGGCFHDPWQNNRLNIRKFREWVEKDALVKFAHQEFPASTNYTLIFPTLEKILKTGYLIDIRRTSEDYLVFGYSSQNVNYGTYNCCGKKMDDVSSKNKNHLPDFNFPNEVSLFPKTAFLQSLEQPVRPLSGPPPQKKRRDEKKAEGSINSTSSESEDSAHLKKFDRTEKIEGFSKEDSSKPLLENKVLNSREDNTSTDSEEGLSSKQDSALSDGKAQDICFNSL